MGDLAGYAGWRIDRWLGKSGGGPRTPGRFAWSNDRQRKKGGQVANAGREFLDNIQSLI